MAAATTRMGPLIGGAVEYPLVGSRFTLPNDPYPRVTTVEMAIMSTSLRMWAWWMFVVALVGIDYNHICKYVSGILTWLSDSEIELQYRATNAARLSLHVQTTFLWEWESSAPSNA
jgi:hypothetical protein